MQAAITRTRYTFFRDKKIKRKLIQNFKVLSKFDTVDYRQFFKCDSGDIPRKNGFKLSNERFHTSITKNFFFVQRKRKIE